MTGVALFALGGFACAEKPPKKVIETDCPKLTNQLGKEADPECLTNGIYIYKKDGKARKLTINNN